MRLTRSTFLTLLICILTPAAVAGQTLGPSDTELGVNRNEFVARSKAVVKAVPAYPEEALARGVEKIETVRIGVNNEGEVVKVKVPPTVSPLLKDVVVEAARRWKFEPLVIKMQPGKYLTNRLTFRFYLEDGKGRVELYLPPYRSAAWDRLGSFAGAGKEWEEWEEVPEQNGSSTEHKADPQ